jgi:hydroxymethylbilane synthase
MNSRPLRLGTRRSALAWVQSSQIAAALRAAHPGLEVELVGIDTRGDRVLDVPLSSIEGKEFFTAEIDAALIEGRVDFTVHSLKDLSLERPKGLILAAVPRRANPRDFAIFAADVPERLADGAGITIGTSSPRRAQLLPPFFARALPHAARNLIKLESLRGNVDSRLRRLREPRGSERHLDGVVLALAGLSRLFADRVRRGKAHWRLKAVRMMRPPANCLPLWKTLPRAVPLPLNDSCWPNTVAVVTSASARRCNGCRILAACCRSAARVLRTRTLPSGAGCRTRHS